MLVFREREEEKRTKRIVRGERVNGDVHVEDNGMGLNFVLPGPLNSGRRLIRNWMI